ncbi:MAG: tyrosine--tRNA ligase [Candidatus Diapherotrites archaeon]|nr:tyrosine--tRNA ligase [Candidatus Diapherotrites archaeon]
MDLDSRLSLVKENTVEVVLEEELEGLLSSKKNPVVYCGYEPSGKVHLGHLVTINKLLQMQKAGFKVKILLADWHAFLNKKGDWEFIKKMSVEWRKIFQKFGLKNAEFVLGSSFQMKSNYFEDVLTLSSHATVNRGLRSMQEVSRDLENAHVSQIVYPLMQIADVKHLKADVAQGGIEQRKIYMLGRETIESIGYKKPVLVHTPLISSLTGSGKMSSSDPFSFISVTDSEETIRQKISKAFCPAGIVEQNPVLEIARLIIFPRLGKLEINRDARFGGNALFESFSALEKEFVARSLHPMDLKKALVDSLCEIFLPAKTASKKSDAFALEKI